MRALGASRDVLVILRSMQRLVCAFIVFCSVLNIDSRARYSATVFITIKGHPEDSPNRYDTLFAPETK